jgi:hypothetical protein
MLKWYDDDVHDFIIHNSLIDIRYSKKIKSVNLKNINNHAYSRRN